jgi:hypothetical protein
MLLLRTTRPGRSPWWGATRATVNWLSWSPDPWVPQKGAFPRWLFTSRGSRRLSHDNLESFARLIHNEKFPSPMDPPCVDKKLRETRLEKCRELLPMLEGLERNNFRSFMTGDESWSTLQFQHSAKWSVCRDDVPQKARNKLTRWSLCWQWHSMLMVFMWRIWRQPKRNLIPRTSWQMFWPHSPRESFQQGGELRLFDCTVTLTTPGSILQKCQKSFHWKSDCPHSASALQPWSGTLWLLAFRPCEGRSGWIVIYRARGVFEGIMVFLGEIQVSELKLVFHHWVERIRWVQYHNGDYYNE